MARRTVWRPPTVKNGGSQPLRETRPDVLERMLARLEKEGTYRQDYSNGEFTSRSVVLSKTFEGAADRKWDLECAHDVAHFDSKLVVWHRETGSFD